MLYYSKDWGFCSQECELYNHLEEESGILRIENGVDVLSEEDCENFLNHSLPRGKSVPFRPKILCIGEHLPYKPDFYVTLDEDVQNTKNWVKATDAFIRNNKHELVKLNEQPDVDDTYWSDYFVESAGTCRGDSGGPLFQITNVIKSGQRYAFTDIL